MRWLVRLYPPAWRRRYGRELEDLLGTQPASFRTAIDLVAGAIDAWVHPQSSTAVAAASPEGGEAMIPKMLHLRNFGCGTPTTAADGLKAAAVMIGGSLAVVAAIGLAKNRYGDDPYLESLRLVLWMVPMLLGLSITELKGRSMVVKAVYVGGLSTIIIAIALVSAWLNA